MGGGGRKGSDQGGDCYLHPASLGRAGSSNWQAKASASLQRYDRITLKEALSSSKGPMVILLLAKPSLPAKSETYSWPLQHT